MAKRMAGKQLTESNWDEEEEAEEAGVFTVATEDVMKGRQVKKAKRRGQTEESTGGSGTFKGFSGFTGFTSSTSTSSGPTFSFNMGGAKQLPIVTNGTSSVAGVSSSTFSLPPAGQQKDGSADSSSVQSSANTNTEQKTTNGSDTSPSKAKYLSQLKSLNLGVTKWIKDHVDKNPCCILTPIFKDYEQYLAEIEKLNPDMATSTKPRENKGDTAQSKETPANTTSIFGGGTTGFTFATGAKDLDSKPFTFSTSSSSKDKDTGAALGTTGFTFATGTKGSDSKPFTFSTLSSSKDKETDAAQDEEPYEPPKPEVNEVKEDDSLFTIRCKLFYQKDGAWVEKGVGNLHLKPCNGKTQLLLRADTSLGNILLNVMLSSSIPLKRQGKNNVSMICIPNPPIEEMKDGQKPVSMLLRVKTAEDADTLLVNLEKYKSE